MGMERTLLSKRAGDMSVFSLRDEGYLPHALINYLALLGWSFEDGRERASLDELIRNFSLERVSSSPSIFDINKMNWINGYYIRQMDDNSFYSACDYYLRNSQGFNSLIRGKDREKVVKLVCGFKSNLNNLSEISKSLEFLFKEDIELTGEEIKFLQSDSVKKVVKSFYRKLKENGELNEFVYKNIIKSIRDEIDVPVKELFMPLRIFLTGRTKGPELDRIIDFLGKEECLQRISRTWEKLFPEDEIEN